MPDLSDLLEVVLDLARPPEARFPHGDVILDTDEVTPADLDYVTSRIGEFGDDNRSGIERTLHRISAIRNRKGRILGITCRVGRAVYGTIATIEDLVFSGKNILLLGRPGVGKTTMLREVSRVLADNARKRSHRRRYFQRNRRRRGYSPTPPSATPAACRLPPPTSSMR